MSLTFIWNLCARVVWWGGGGGERPLLRIQKHSYVSDNGCKKAIQNKN